MFACVKMLLSQNSVLLNNLREPEEFNAENRYCCEGVVWDAAEDPYTGTAF